MKTKIYLLNTENIKDPKCYDSWKRFLPKDRWEKTVRPIKEEDRKMELAVWLLLYYALKEWGIPSDEINEEGAYCYGEHGKPMRKKKDIYFNLSHSGNYVLCVLASEEIGCDIEKIREVKWKLAKRFFSEKEYDILEHLKENNKNDREDGENIANRPAKIDAINESGAINERKQSVEVNAQNKSAEKNIVDEDSENRITAEEMFTRFWTLRESYVKKTGEGLGTALKGLDFSDVLVQMHSKRKKNGEFLTENFFEIEYDGYHIAVCGEKTSEPEFIVCGSAIDNCFL